MNLSEIKNIQARFFSKVDKTDGCWLWTGAKQNPRPYQPIGYGVIVVSSNPSRVAVLAHRLSWILHYGEIPEGQEVLHHCDNPPCVNPSHLFLGDQAANMADCATKMRKTRGEAHYRAKLTSAQVADIKRLSREGYTRHRLEVLYGRGKTTIEAILTGRTWRHIS